MLTDPYHDYEQEVEQTPTDDVSDDIDLGSDEHLVQLRDRTWPEVVGWESPFPPTDEHRRRYPVGTDRRALVDAAVSVSPLSVTHGSPDSAALATVVETVDVA